jgi:CubicO group peptidase (beta-lactamase class C family)
VSSTDDSSNRHAIGLLIGALVLTAAACSDDAEPGSSDPATATTGPTARPASTTTASAEYDFSGVSPIVERFVDERDLNGAALIVVERDDGFIDEEYWGDFGPDRVSLIASSSKMISAGVLLRLHDDGLLDIDAPVAEIADWGAGNPTITPAQLLSNSSGLVGLFPDPAYTPYACQRLASGTLQDCAERIFSTPDDDTDVVTPDTEFRYGGAQWQVAGAVAEVASGKPWSQLIDEIYVQPCGLETLAYNNHITQLGADRFGYPTAFAADPSTLQSTDNPNIEGGVYIAPPDYAALLLMHLRGGRCGDTQVLSQAALDHMHTDRIGATYGGDAVDPGMGYGMGWWVERASGRISDPGAYGSVPWVDLEDHYGVYLVIEADLDTGSQLAEALYDIIEQAVNAA